MSSPGPLWDAQITQNGTRGGSKWSQNRKMIDFWRVDFLMIFWMAPFSHFCVFSSILGSQKVPACRSGSVHIAYFFVAFFPMPLPSGPRTHFAPTFGRLWYNLGTIWVAFGMDLGSNHEMGFAFLREISRGNLAQTLHKILQWTWAIPPAGTNSEGAAVSR